MPVSNAITKDIMNGIPSSSNPGVDIRVPAFMLHEGPEGRKKMNRFPRAVKTAVITIVHVNNGMVIFSSSYLLAIFHHLHNFMSFVI